MGLVEPIAPRSDLEADKVVQSILSLRQGVVMNGQRADFWFPVKSYGWGWGLPVRWQGWVVLAAYFALLYAGIRYFGGRQHVVGLLGYLLAITVALIVIVVAKGERPVGWRWGND